MSATTPRYTLADLASLQALPENQDKLLELIEGEIHEKMGSFIPSLLAARMIGFLLRYLEETPIGYVTGADGSYVLSEHNKPIPDVAFISKTRLPELPSREAPVPPDLAVEVISPNDSIREAQKKALLYLRHGVQMVWLVYPEDQSMDVFTPADEGAHIRTYTREDTLIVGELLPNFELSLAKLFADL